MIEVVKSSIPLRAYLAEHGIEGKGKLYRCIGRDHEDRNPSGWTYQGRDGFERFHCGGCGLDVDVIGAAQELHGLDFKGALRLLADRAGVKTGRQTPAEARGALSAKRERERKHELVQAFRQWEQKMVDDISAVLRDCRRLKTTRTDFSEAELMSLAELQGVVDYLSYIYEEVFCKADDGPKYALFKEGMGYAAD